MKIRELDPQPLIKELFRFSSLKYIPKEAGCYVLVTFDNNILYIGLTSDLSARYQQHLNNPGKTNTTKEGKAVWFYFMLYDSNNLPKLERTWINSFVAVHGSLPFLNKVNSPIS